MTTGLSGLRLLSAFSVGGGMTGGEGLAVHAGPGGRCTLFMAAEHAPADFAAIDVTDPRQPSVICGATIPAGVRSNNLAILGDLLGDQASEDTERATSRSGVLRHRRPHPAPQRRLLRRVGPALRWYPFRMARRRWPRLPGHPG